MPREGSAADVRRKQDRLRALSRSPQLGEYALELVANERHAELLLAALAALGESPPAAAHDALVRRYEEFERAGRQRDAGGLVRAALIRAMEPIALPGDLPLLARAVEVHEPSPHDAAAPTGLRAAALATMLRLDPELASYHAAVMLHDQRRTSQFTGEPAATAVRVLAAAGEEVALVGFALGGGHPEVLAECLRQLRSVPSPVLAKVVGAARGAASDETVGLGLCDLFVRHEPDGALRGQMVQFMRHEATPELYHYLAAAIVAERRDDLLEALGEAAREETHREKLKALGEALEVRRGDPAVEALAEAVRKRQARS
ncbi:MAG: hypothetical protein M0R74_04145 [Dehalococcoidia bacterium]|nr:hypothetical protein [Dehalococcoidia bacterium]